jgi:DNA-binding CsgD family transcriptional regulator
MTETKRRKGRKRPPLSKKDLAYARRWRAGGLGLATIAERLDCSVRMVWKVLHQARDRSLPDGTQPPPQDVAHTTAMVGD